MCVIYKWADFFHCTMCIYMCGGVVVKKEVSKP